jgi:beta-lactamase class A
MDLLAVDKNIKDLLLSFSGRASYKIEIGNETIEHNSNGAFRSASTIKIPILIEGFRQYENQTIYLNQSIKIPSKEKVGGSGVLRALSDNMNMTVKDLMSLMIIVSDNTATNLMINFLGQHNINQCIKKLGLKQTMLNRKMMDFKSMAAGKDNFTSAADLIVCLKAINEDDFLLKDSNRQILSILKNQQFADKLPAFMDLDKVSFAGKSGGLDGVSHDCGIFQYRDKVLYAAVLTDGFDSNEEARRLIANIGKLVFDYLIDS